MPFTILRIPLLRGAKPLKGLEPPFTLTVSTFSLSLAQSLTYTLTGYQCEVLRAWGIKTKATLLVLGKLERTQENMRLAELELQENPDRLADNEIAEERKTLAWVQEKTEGEGNPSAQAIAPSGLGGGN